MVPRWRGWSRIGDRLGRGSSRGVDDRETPPSPAGAAVAQRRGDARPAARAAESQRQGLDAAADGPADGGRRGGDGPDDGREWAGWTADLRDRRHVRRLDPRHDRRDGMHPDRAGQARDDRGAPAVHAPTVANCGRRSATPSASSGRRSPTAIPTPTELWSTVASGGGCGSAAAATPTSPWYGSGSARRRSPLRWCPPQTKPVDELEPLCATGAAHVRRHLLGGARPAGRDRAARLRPGLPARPGRAGAGPGAGAVRPAGDLPRAGRPAASRCASSDANRAAAGSGRSGCRTPASRPRSTRSGRCGCSRPSSPRWRRCSTTCSTTGRGSTPRRRADAPAPHVVVRHRRRRHRRLRPPDDRGRGRRASPCSTCPTRRRGCSTR